MFPPPSPSRSTTTAKSSSTACASPRAGKDRRGGTSARGLGGLVASLALALTARAHARPIPPDPRDALAAQVAAEQTSLATTIATVLTKLHGAEDIRRHRLHAALRALHAALPEGASADERMAVARRRAAARLLLERDRGERAILADEAAVLARARAVADEAAPRIATIALPEALESPARGRIARHFGAYQHDRSKAMLSRRGVDLEVEDHAPAVAPADGVVRYAGPIRGLDHGVILDHGDYLTVVAKLGELALLAGTHVAKGDRLGRAAHHRVYLEVRAKIGPGGLPIDPEPWLAH